MLTGSLQPMGACGGLKGTVGLFRPFDMRSENVVLDPFKNQKGAFAPHFFR